MGKYGLAKCPVFKEDGDAWETAPFGERRGTYTHKGVDIVRHIGSNTTATITAIAGGTVIGVRTTVTGVNHAAEVEGNYVAIDHGGGMVTKYFHLRYGSIPAAIRKGAKVKPGTPSAIWAIRATATARICISRLKKTASRLTAHRICVVKRSSAAQSLRLTPTLRS